VFLWWIAHIVGASRAFAGDMMLLVGRGIILCSQVFPPIVLPISLLLEDRILRLLEEIGKLIREK